MERIKRALIFLGRLLLVVVVIVVSIVVFKRIFDFIALKKFYVDSSVYFMTIIGQITILGIVLGFYQLIPTQITREGNKRHTYLRVNLIEHILYEKTNFLNSFLFRIFPLFFVGITISLKPLLKIIPLTTIENYMKCQYEFITRFSEPILSLFLYENEERLVDYLSWLYSLWYLAAIGYFFIMFLVLMYALGALRDINKISGNDRDKYISDKLSRKIEKRVFGEKKYKYKRKVSLNAAFKERINHILESARESEDYIYRNLYNKLLVKNLLEYRKKQSQIAKYLLGKHKLSKKLFYRHKYGISRDTNVEAYIKTNRKVVEEINKIVDYINYAEDHHITRCLVDTHLSIIQEEMAIYAKQSEKEKNYELNIEIDFSWGCSFTHRDDKKIINKNIYYWFELTHNIYKKLKLDERIYLLKQLEAGVQKSNTETTNVVADAYSQYCQKTFNKIIIEETKDAIRAAGDVDELMRIAHILECDNLQTQQVCEELTSPSYKRNNAKTEKLVDITRGLSDESKLYIIVYHIIYYSQKSNRKTWQDINLKVLEQAWWGIDELKIEGTRIVDNIYERLLNSSINFSNPDKLYQQVARSIDYLYKKLDEELFDLIRQENIIDSSYFAIIRLCVITPYDTLVVSDPYQNPLYMEMIHDISEYNYIAELLESSTMEGLLDSIRYKKAKRKIEKYEGEFLKLEFLLLADVQSDEILGSDTLKDFNSRITGKHLLIKTIDDTRISQVTKELIFRAYRNDNKSVPDYIAHLAQVAVTCKQPINQFDQRRMEVRLNQILSEKISVT